MAVPSVGWSFDLGAARPAFCSHARTAQIKLASSVSSLLAGSDSFCELMISMRPTNGWWEPAFSSCRHRVLSHTGKLPYFSILKGIVGISPHRVVSRDHACGDSHRNEHCNHHDPRHGVRRADPEQTTLYEPGSSESTK